MATLAENAAAVKAAQVAIDAAIVAKGGETEGGLDNAAAAIAALPSGGEVVPLSVTANGTYTPPSGVDGYAPVTVDVPAAGEYDGDDLIIVYDCINIPSASKTFTFSPGATSGTVYWGDGESQVVTAYRSASHEYDVRGIYTIRFVNTSSRGEMNGWASIRAHGVVEVFLPSWGVYMQNDSGVTLQDYCTCHFNSAWASSSMMLHGDFRAIGDFRINAGDMGHGGNGSLAAKYNIILGPAITDFGTRSLYEGTNTGVPFVVCTNSVMTVTLPEGVETTISNLAGMTKLVALKGLSKLTVVGARADGIFSGNSALLVSPEIYAPDATDATNLFKGCTSLYSLPKMTINCSVSFAPCTAVADKDSVAMLEDGTITGGFVYHLNTCSNDGQTITLNATIKALFDATEQAEIAATLAAKNWTLAW